MTRLLRFSSLLPLCLIVSFAAEQDHKQWNDYGGGPDSSHFVDLNQFTRENVNQLQVAWTYPTQDQNSVAESSKQGFLYVFDRVTGKPLWPIKE